VLSASKLHGRWQTAYVPFATDIGVGITGIAGPGGETPEKTPIGLVYICVNIKGVSAVTENHLIGNREMVQKRSMLKAFKCYANFEFRLTRKKNRVIIEQMLNKELFMADDNREQLIFALKSNRKKFGKAR
jgi:hypothetical protein